MFEGIGNPVRKLKRVRIGPVVLGSLPLGAFRTLTAQEIQGLKAGVRKPRSSRAEEKRR
jgi:16S rRNA U516 pseudouridylate synthase RsuA-like enzyme